MSPIAPNLAAGFAHAPTGALDPAQPQDHPEADTQAHVAAPSTFDHAPAAAQSLSRLMPDGGLHPVAGVKTAGTTPTAKTVLPPELRDKIRAILAEAYFVAVMNEKTKDVKVTPR
jgi:hypothetical protein